MTKEEADKLAEGIVVDYFWLNTCLDGVLVLNGLDVKKLEVKYSSCVAIELLKPLHENIYFIGNKDFSYDKNQTYLEVFYSIIDSDTTTDAEIKFYFEIRDSEKVYPYAAFAQTHFNRESYSYYLCYRPDGVSDIVNLIFLSRTNFKVIGEDDTKIIGDIPFIGLYNNKCECDIKIDSIKRSYMYDIIEAKDYNFSDSRGAFPNIYIKGSDSDNNKIESLSIHISDIALAFYEIDEIKNLELTFNSEDKSREKEIFKEYIDYRLTTDYINDSTNISLLVMVWNLELAFSDYQLIKHNKLFTILAFKFDKAYLDRLLKEQTFPKNLYVEDKTKLYSALLQQAKTIEQKITLHRYVAYYSSRLDKWRRIIFWLTEDYNKITHPIFGLLLCMIITSTINTFYRNFDVISIANINDIFKYRFDLSCIGLLNFIALTISIGITTIFGYLLFALSIAIKRRFGMGNPKDMD